MNDKNRNVEAPARRGKFSKAQKLATAAQAAADVRGYDTNPDVIAYRIERMRARVDRLIWTGLVLGLLFTMANVQSFAAAGAKQWEIEWWIAWLLDPMVSLVLLGVLLGEQIIARQRIKAGRWVRRTKWTALALTYAMNTWQAWAELNPAAILLHSVPPIMVFCAAEAVTTLKHQITEAVHKAYHLAAVRAAAIANAEATAAAHAQAVADAHLAALPTSAEEEGSRAVADITTWLKKITPFVPEPLTAATVSPSVEVTTSRAEEWAADDVEQTSLPDTEPLTPALTDDDSDDEQDSEQDREESSDRKRPDDQDNRSAEAWIRTRCRGTNGVGKRPSWSEVAKQFTFSEGWAGRRINTVQDRMTAQGYEFQTDGTVLAPRKTLTEPVTAPPVPVPVNGSTPSTSS